MTTVTAYPKTTNPAFSYTYAVLLTILLKKTESQNTTDVGS